MQTTHQASSQADHDKVIDKPESTIIDWQQINADYEKSGLSQKLYCERHGISLNQFTYQRQLLRQKGSTKKKLASVILQDSASGLSSGLPNSHSDCFMLEWPNGTRLIIPNRFDAKALNFILTTLGNL